MKTLYKRTSSLPASTKPKASPRQKPSRLPFVFLNVAMTADGKIATANRAISSFGSKNDQRQLFLLRTQADAVMAGARTVDLNEVTMGPGAAEFRRMRTRNGLAEYNIRVIVSGSGSIDPNAEIFKHRFSPIIILTGQRAPKQALNTLRTVADDVHVSKSAEIDFREALAWLRERWQVKRLLCEGGGELNSALFAANAVDEVYTTVGPFIFGGRNAPTLSDGRAAESRAEATRLRMQSMKRIDNEMFLRLRVVKSK